MSLLSGCVAGTTQGANIKVKAKACLIDDRIASFDDRDNDDPSDDVTLKQCKSGFVADKNLVFVDGKVSPFEQCCKCKPGEACELCAIPTNCTDDEKKKFVAKVTCFGNGGEVSPTTTKTETKKIETDLFKSIKWWHALIVLFVMILLGFIVGKMLSNNNNGISRGY